MVVWYFEEGCVVLLKRVFDKYLFLFCFTLDYNNVELPVLIDGVECKSGCGISFNS